MGEKINDKKNKRRKKDVIISMVSLYPHRETKLRTEIHNNEVITHITRGLGLTVREYGCPFTK